MPKPTALVRSGTIARPTRTAWLLFAFAILLELLGRLVNSTAIAVAAAAALGAVIADAVLTPRIDRITVHRHSPTRMTVGVDSFVQLIIVKATRWQTRMAPLLIIDDHPSLGTWRLMTPPLTEPRTVINLRAIAEERGHWAPNAGHITLEAHSPLGLFVRRRPSTLSHERWVHPAPARPVSLPDTSLGAATGTAGSNRTGQGMEFYGIREWRSGDASGSVHWRASARRNQLVVMERERPERAALVVLVGEATPGPSWEVAVARAAATAVAARALGQSVKLICGMQAATPDSPTDILDWFAALDAASTVDQGALVEELRRLGPGATVLWVATTIMSSDVAHAVRAAHATVVPIGTNDTPAVLR